jgi:dCMP deaminase
MKQKWIDAFMDTAERFAQLSSSRRLRVGAVVVKDDRITSIGYNGTPAGWDNNCEYEVQEFQTEYGVGSKLVNTGELKTKKEVIHAEANAISKLAKSTEAGEGSWMFCTHAPCIDCAKMIYGAGIKTLVYRDDYRSEEGLDLLRNCNVEVKKYLTIIQN